jgi:pilus assembly protein CpaE
MNRLSFVIGAPSPELGQVFEASGQIEVLAQVGSASAIVEVVADKRPDALLVSLFEDPQAVFAAIEALQVPRPMVFCFGPDDSHLILQSMRLGACEYVAPGPHEKLELLAAVERIAREQAGSNRVAKAPLIAVTGAKGGVGASFVACQLGAQLAQMGSRPVLVDGQLRLGDVALYLDLSPEYTFASLANRGETLDPTYLQSVLARHESGLQILATPKHPEDAEVITVDCVNNVLNLLQSEFDWVIWDTPQDFDERSVHILDNADPIVLVTTPDVPAMNHARMQLDLLERIGHRHESIRVIVNRTDRSSSVSEKAAREFLGRSVDVSIPNDYARASACVNEGRTLREMAPRAPVTKAMTGLARHSYEWCELQPPNDEGSSSGIMGRLMGK